MKKAHSVQQLCQAFDVARSSYYDWLNRQQRTPSTAHIKELAEAQAVHRETRASYGSRRMSAELKRRGYPAGRFKARRLMREAGLQVKRPKPSIYPASKGKPAIVAKNMLNREFNVATMGTHFAGDITYIATQQGWSYLAIVMDLCQRRIVGWATSKTPNTALVVEALQLALNRRHHALPLMFHSDQGCQYTSQAFRQFLTQHNINQSMSRRGNCWDNAPVERFFRSLKTEWIGKTVYANHGEARLDINRFISCYYNRKRLHSTLGYRPPAECQDEATELTRVA